MMVSNKQTGVGMIEILVTIAVVTVGFFALLVLQMRTIEDASNSNQQLAATILANEMGERIRANITKVDEYHGINTHATLNCTGTMSRMDACAWKAALEEESYRFFSLSDKTDPDSAVLDGAQGEVMLSGRNAVITVSWLEKIDRTNKKVKKNQSISYTLEVPVL